MSLARNKFCVLCPRQLRKPTTEPCSLGLQFVESLLDKKRDEDTGCPWGIASAEHGYCFWTYIRAQSDDDGRMDPVPDSEICALLGITQAALEKTLASGIAKLKAAKDSMEMQEFRQAVIDRVATIPDDNTVYMPDNFRVPTPEPEEDENPEGLPAELLEKPKRRRMNSMPLHRDGRKTDIFGITSRKKMVKR